MYRVTSTLMGRRQYARGFRSIGSHAPQLMLTTGPVTELSSPSSAVTTGGNFKLSNYVDADELCWRTLKRLMDLVDCSFRARDKTSQLSISKVLSSRSDPTVHARCGCRSQKCGHKFLLIRDCLDPADWDALEACYSQFRFYRSRGFSVSEEKWNDLTYRIDSLVEEFNNNLDSLFIESMPK
jgi:hypothetical protein